MFQKSKQSTEINLLPIIYLAPQSQLINRQPLQIKTASQVLRNNILSRIAIPGR